VYPQIEDPIPIGMLLAEVTFFPDDSAELFGFCCYKETTLPETRQEKKMFPADLAMARCSRLRLIGSSQQIEDILFFLSHGIQGRMKAGSPGSRR
jgi:hypothetical protein